MDFQPIPDHAALLAGENLVVTDLHIGLEAEIQRRGVYVTSQTMKMAQRLIGLLDKHAPRRLVLLGDVKHFIPGTTALERRDLPRFFTAVAAAVPEIRIAPGNHDALIRYALPASVRIGPPSGFTAGGFGFLHGHAWPSKRVMAAKVLLAGHNHPAFVAVDELGHRTVAPAWVRFPLRRQVKGFAKVARELVIVPTFNPLCGGTPVNDTAQRLLGPLISSRVARVEEGELHLLDGTYLGRLGDLRVEARYRGADYRQ